MSVDDRRQAAWQAMQDENAARYAETTEARGSLKHGGGDGTLPPMEARIAKLESDIGHVKDSLKKLESASADLTKSVADLRVDSAKISTTVSTLPDKDYLATKLNQVLRNTSIVVAIVATILGLVLKLTPG